MAISIERKIARLTTAIEREAHFLRLPGIGVGPRRKAEAKLASLMLDLKTVSRRVGKPIERKNNRLRVGEKDGGPGMRLKKAK